MREVPCPSCKGARLKPESLAVLVEGKHISDVCDLSIGESAKFLAELELSDRDSMIAERITKEINARLGFLLDVGLDYLTLSRAAGTLAATASFSNNRSYTMFVHSKPKHRPHRWSFASNQTMRLFKSIWNLRNRCYNHKPADLPGI